MALYSSPPPAQPFSDAKPTLLVAWWITIFCTCLTLLRLAGRFIRIEKLFLEDKIAALSLVPLYLRIACIHVVLLYGTNNALLDPATVTPEELDRRATGSKVVLAGRVFYAATYVLAKITQVAIHGTNRRYLIQAMDSQIHYSRIYESAGRCFHEKAISQINHFLAMRPWSHICGRFD